MGMLDFVKDIGHKLFGDNDDPAEAIKKHIEASNPGVENLGVTCENGFVTLSGQCADPEAAEKAMLMAGNVHGVGKVVSNIEVKPTDGQPARAESEGIEYYTIKSGDTLSAIAKHYYGDASQYNKVFEANREVIKDPDKIFVGQKIRIPLAG